MSLTTSFRRGPLAALLALLVACGGGVVGTGSGPGDPAENRPRYQPGPLCGADFAAAGLACFTDGRDLDAGTLPVQWSDGDAAALASLEGNTLELQVPCARLAFRGNWGLLPDGRHGFVGTATGTLDAGGRPAIVSVAPAPEAPGAVGWLRVASPDGLTLHGPWLMRRADAAVTPAACPD